MYFRKFLAIGCRGDNSQRPSTGAVYIYRFIGNSWQYYYKIVSSDASAGDNFGISVNIYDNVLMVGAHSDDIFGNNSGSAYLYTNFNNSTFINETTYCEIITYPNPTNNLITIQASEDGEPVDVVNLIIYDINGCLIFHSDNFSTKNSLDLSNFQNSV